MDGWMDGVTATGQAASLPPSQQFRSRHRGSSWRRAPSEIVQSHLYPSPCIPFPKRSYLLRAAVLVCLGCTISHGSKPLALKVVLPNTRSDCSPSASGGKNGPSSSRKTFLPGHGTAVGHDDSLVFCSTRQVRLHSMPRWRGS